MEPQEKNTKRRWWIAGLFSYLLPGLGQVYNGQATKGLLFNFVFSLWGGIVFSLIYYSMKGTITQLNVVILFLVLFLSFLAHLFIIIEAIRAARRMKEPYVIKVYNKWYLYILAILVTIAVDYSFTSVTRDRIVKPYRIPAASMKPTLLVGDYMLSNQMYYSHHDPVRGDIIVFKYPKDERLDYIKRIIGMPGDTLEIINKELYINNKKYTEPYVEHIDSKILSSDSGPRDNLGPVVIPQDQYFGIGDNRDNSADSRHWGNIKRHQIKGKPLFIYWSWDGKISSWNLIAKLFSIRLGRFGKLIK